MYKHLKYALLVAINWSFYADAYMIKIERELFDAVIKGDVEKTASLIKSGADVNAVYEKSERGELKQCLIGATALHVAAGECNFVVAEELIKNGADIDFKSQEFGTPLHVAVRLSCPIVAEQLVRAGADIDARDSDGLTPLSLANQLNDPLRLLLWRMIGIYDMKYNMNCIKGIRSGLKDFRRWIGDVILASLFLPIGKKMYYSDETIQAIMNAIKMYHPEALELTEKLINEKNEWSVKDIPLVIGGVLCGTAFLLGIITHCCCSRT